MRALLLTVLLAFPALASAGLLDREQPDVAAGTEALARGAFDEALARYDAAAAALPEQAEVHHNRGNALYGLGRYEEAQAAWIEALAHRRDEAGAAADYFHLGNALAQQGMVDEAIDSYRRALRIDPAAEEPRRNLERLLRRRQQEQEQQQQQQDEQQQEQQQGEDESQQQGAGGEQQQGEGEDEQAQADREQQGEDGGEQPRPGEGDEQQEPGEGEGEPDPGQQQAEAQQQGAGQGTPEGERPGAAAAAGEAGEGEMQRSDAVRLLDALRDGEQNFQLWRYQKNAKDKGNVDVDKEW